MRFTQIALLSSPILAFTIPKGQTDGVYQVSYVDGQEIHTLVNQTDQTAQPSSSPGLTASAKFRAKRDAHPYITCGGDALDHGYTDKANAELDEQCGNGAWVNAGHDFYSIANCVVAYYCNFYITSNTCSAADRRTASADITNKCGWYQSGWARSSNDWGGDSYGYEDICKASGNNFCGRGTHG